MALIYEIIRQNKKDLTLLGWNNAIDMDILIGSGCVSRIETSYVGMAMFGLAHKFRKAVENGKIYVSEHSETTAIDAFRAGSYGWTFFPTKTPLGSGIEKYNKNIRHINCPYTGEKYCLLPAFSPDVAIIHAHVADYVGNVQLDAKRELDNEVDTLIAKSAKKVIVSVEQIVSEDFIYRNPELTILPKFFVDAVVELPYGAHPTACDCRYDYDSNFFEDYQNHAKDEKTYQEWLTRFVYDVGSHYEYLTKVGIKDLFSITRPKEIL
jgi:glutaconate CoA-transferase subunit A